MTRVHCLEAIVAIPTDMFYDTGIATCVWILTNRKHPSRKGKVQLISVTEVYQKMRKSLGSKRKELGDEDIARIVELYEALAEQKESRIFANEDFGYTTVTVERALRVEQGNVLLDKKGKPTPDPKLRDSENVPLKESIEDYFAREVLPHVPAAFLDRETAQIDVCTPYSYDPCSTDVRSQHWVFH